LLIFRKAAFTLDDVMEDIAGFRVGLEAVIIRYALTHWMKSTGTVLSLLSVSDWIALDWSALAFASRFCTQALLRPWTWLPRMRLSEPRS
jgi:hypothetical protein